MKNIIMKLTITIIIALCTTNIFAQAIYCNNATVFYYNLWNYPGNTPERYKEFKKIFNYYKPDIILVSELQNENGAKKILDNAINTNSSTKYKIAPFIDGPDTDEEIFYNSEMFSLYKTDTIKTALRNINHYTLFYNFTSNSIPFDTTFFHVFCAHLKAGTTEEEARSNEILKFIEYIKKKKINKNIILGGDFNLYSSDEKAYKNITTNDYMPLIDPVGVGEWHENSAFSYYHTQNTRTYFDGVNQGGLDDRFDIIFMSQDIYSNLNNNIQYIQNSYTAIANDGLRLNMSILESSIIPDSIAIALYNMSDHLPVSISLCLKNSTTSINSYKKQRDYNIIQNDNEKTFLINNSNPHIDICLYDLTGKFISFVKPNEKFNYSSIKQGIYFVKIIDKTNTYSQKIIIN